MSASPASDRRRTATIRACPACGVRNRVPVEHLAETGRCGSCKASCRVRSADRPLSRDVLRAARVAIWGLRGAWCGPCRWPLRRCQRTEKHGGAALVSKSYEDHPELASATT